MQQRLTSIAVRKFGANAPRMSTRRTVFRYDETSTNGRSSGSARCRTVLRPREAPKTRMRMMLSPAAGLCALGVLALLAGCAGDSATTSLAPNASAAPVAAAAPAAQPAKPQRLTATQINEKCWMSAEANKVADLDKRMRVVDKCIAEKTKEQGQ